MKTEPRKGYTSWSPRPQGYLFNRKDIEAAVSMARSVDQGDSLYMEAYRRVFKRVVEARILGDYSAPLGLSRLEEFFYMACCGGSVLEPLSMFTTKQVEVLGRMADSISLAAAEHKTSWIMLDTTKSRRSGATPVLYPETLSYVYCSARSLKRELDGVRADLFTDDTSVNILIADRNDMRFRYPGNRLVVLL